MKPIKKGMTEAVTRDGRKVTQLTWFDVDESEEVYAIGGVVDGELYFWLKNGKKESFTLYSDNDIFAPVEYEWQWLVKTDEGVFETTIFHKSYEELVASGWIDARRWTVIGRIEESKREVLTD